MIVVYQKMIVVNHYTIISLLQIHFDRFLQLVDLCVAGIAVNAVLGQPFYRRCFSERSFVGIDAESDFGVNFRKRFRWT